MLTENPLNAEEKLTIAVESNPEPVMVRRFIGASEEFESAVITIPGVVAMTVTVALPVLLASWADVAVTVTGFVLGTELGAV